MAVANAVFSLLDLYFLILTLIRAGAGMQGNHRRYAEGAALSIADEQESLEFVLFLVGQWIRL